MKSLGHVNPHGDTEKHRVGSPNFHQKTIKNHKLDNLPGIPRLLGAGGEPWVLCVHYPLRPHPPASLLSSAVTSRGEATVHVHACKERGGGRGYNTSQLDHIHSLNFAAAGGRECTPPQLSCYRSRIGEGCVFTRCGQNTGLFTFCRCLPTLSTPMNKLVVTCWTLKGGIILITACRIGWQSGRSNLLFPLRRSVSSLNCTGDLWALSPAAVVLSSC